MTKRKLDWDYTALAKAYTQRPDYSDAAITAALAIVDLPEDAVCLDLGAGAAHLTLKLAERGLSLTALEPNDAMRAEGMDRTAAYEIDWVNGVMEQTELPGRRYALVTYGSSFGVVDRGATLVEAARLLRPGGWMMCLFNHRDLDDPLQTQIEDLIKASVMGYDYGTRREDQTSVIEESGLFEKVHRLECPVIHRVGANNWIEAWRSHATLQRQAGPAFESIVSRIADLVGDPAQTLEIPYTTRVWLARSRGPA